MQDKAEKPLISGARSLSRLEEGVGSAIEEIPSRIERDSHLLNATPAGTRYS